MRVRPALGVLRRAVEGAELARGHADVGVVDVAVDQVGDDAVGVAPAAYRVGRLAQRVQRRLGVEQQRLLGRDPAAVGAALQDVVDARRRGSRRLLVTNLERYVEREVGAAQCTRPSPRDRHLRSGCASPNSGMFT